MNSAARYTARMPPYVRMYMYIYPARNPGSLSRGLGVNEPPRCHRLQGPPLKYDWHRLIGDGIKGGVMLIQAHLVCKFCQARLPEELVGLLD